MHNMLIPSIISVLGFAASSQALALPTSDANLVPRADYRPPVCDNVAAGDSICGKTGKVATRTFVGGPTSGPFYINQLQGPKVDLDRCRALCQETAGCLSMSWNSDTKTCALYAKNSADQGFVAGSGGSLKFYDKNCFSCQYTTCFPTLYNNGFEYSTTGHIGPWLPGTDSASNIKVVAEEMGQDSHKSLSLTANPGQHVSVYQPFKWCFGQSTSYKISFYYKFLNNIPGSGMDVDYSGLSGHGGPPTQGTTIFDTTNPGNSDWQFSGPITVTPQFAASLTFYVYSNPFYAESQEVLLDSISVIQQQ